jgi:hypothetical protein
MAGVERILTVRQQALRCQRAAALQLARLLQEKDEQRQQAAESSAAHCEGSP